MEYQLIESDQALADLLAANRGATVVMVDTEFMRQDTFYPQAALIQLCFGDQAWLVDPLAIQDFGPLCELFTNPDVVKVLHSASEDLEVFNRLLGVLPLPLFDTQRAAAFLNKGFGLGYRALVETACGLELGKGETRSNWLRRPLTESQLSYAAQDVIPLYQVYLQQLAALEQRGRLDWLLEEGEQAVLALQAPAAPAYLRIKSAARLQPQQLGVLAQICEWREERARLSDKPRNWILHDKACFNIARTLPKNRGQMADIEDLPTGVLRKQGDQLLELVQRGLELDPAQQPQALPAALGREAQDTLKALKGVGRSLAEALDIAPELIMSSRDYELLVRLGAGQKLPQPQRWQGWRREPVIEPLLQHVGAAS
jgi:ribonuclease D